MSCNKYKEMISTRLDNELSDDDIKTLEEHIQICTTCKKFAEELTNIKNINSVVNIKTIPEETEQKILNNTINQIKEKKSFWLYLTGHYRIPRGFAWAGVLLVILSAGNLIFTSRDVPDKTTSQSQFINAQPAVQRIVISEDDIVSAGGVSREPRDI